MDMTETPTPAAPAKPRRKPVRRKAAAAPKPELPSELAGLTPTDCCDGCNDKRCAISGSPVCAHPFKGGLQSSMMGDPAAMKRHGAAKKALAHLKIEIGAA